ncbi:MAG: P-loop NTPase [Acetobacteraceae bacterium]|nr:P-loop NTPase [Acetobacteraceae bacterium]
MILRPTARASRPRLIAVASGKGGVGKTWFAISLAQALAGQRLRILLVDADVGLANVDVQLGLDPKRDISALLRGEPVASCLTPLPALGFDVIAGRSGSGALAGADEATADRILSALAAPLPYDLAVLDLGAGIERLQRRLSAAADTLLVLTTEEPTALTDAYACLKLATLDNPAGDRRIVVNLAPSRAAGERTASILQKSCARFLGAAPPLAGVIRRDPRVAEAIRRQQPFLTRHPTSDAARDVESIASALLPVAA